MNVPGLSGYLAGQQYTQQTDLGNLQKAKAVMGLQADIRAQQQDDALKAAIAQSGGDVEAVMKAALQSGNLAAAAKLAPLVEEKRKAAQPRILTPGSQVIGPDNKVIHQAPFATPPVREVPMPELVRLQEHLGTLPAGDPRRAPVESRIKLLSERAPQRVAADSNDPEGTGFTPDALDLRARQYLSGDPRAMANLGRGNQGSNRIVQITNRAAALLREQGGTPEEIGRRIAEFRANSNSLSKMTQSYDAIVAFEQTAVRNGKILKDLADKVDSTGTPVIERWIRAGRKEIAGDTDVARFHAQLQVYRTEAARILTNPNLTGQLTDSARKEVEEFMKPGASAGQIKGVVDLLERDFANRKGTLEQQMRDIRKRLEKNISAGETDAAPATAPTAPGGWDQNKEKRYQELLKKRGS
jgi:hypothetical protein